MLYCILVSFHYIKLQNKQPPQAPGAYNNKGLLPTHGTCWLQVCFRILIPGHRQKEQPLYETCWFVTKPQESPKASALMRGMHHFYIHSIGQASLKTELDGNGIVNIILLQAGRQRVGSNSVIYSHVIPHNAATTKLYRCVSVDLKLHFIVGLYVGLTIIAFMFPF